MRQRLRVVAQALAGVAQVVVGLRAVGQQRGHALQAIEAGGQLACLLQDDAQVVPALGQPRVGGHRAPGGRLGFVEPSLLAAHFRQIAAIGGRRRGRLAGRAQMRQRQRWMAVRMRDQAEQMPRVRLVRNRVQHPQAKVFGLRGLTGVPVRVGQGDGLADGQRRGGAVGGRAQEGRSL